MRSAIFLLTFSFALFVACSPFDPSEDIISNIETEFSLDMREKLSTEGGIFNFVVASTEKKPCDNSTIQHYSSMQEKEIDLHILKVVQPDNCYGESYPHAWIPMDELDEGSFQLKIELPNSIQNKGIFEYSNDVFRITVFSPKGVVIVNKTLNKIPDNLCWGYVYSTVNKQLEAQFLEELEGITSRAILPQGNYGYFKIQPNKAVELIDYPEEYLAPFIVDFQDQKVLIQQLFEKYEKAYGAFIQIHLFTSDGDEYLHK